MPVSLMEFHAAGPMSADGEPRFVLRNRESRPSRLPLAERYRQAIEEREVAFNADHQRRLLDIVVDRQTLDGYRCFGVAVDDQKLLVLVAWTTGRDTVDLRAAIKSALARGMNREFGRQVWLGEGGGAKRVRNRTQFDYLVNTQLPSRGGLVWTAARGFTTALAHSA